MSGRHWTPFQIRILLHHHTGPSPFPQALAPQYAKEIEYLERRGMIRCKANPLGSDPSGISLTDKGEVFIELILQTPEPLNIWLDPRNNKEILPENDMAGMTETQANT